MAGGAEGDALSPSEHARRGPRLGGDGGVGVQGVVGGDEAGDVDEVFGQGWLAGLVWRLDCVDGAHARIVLVM
jgi:hypothetical protein